MELAAHQWTRPPPHSTCSPFLAAPQPLLRIESPVQQQETAGTGVASVSSPPPYGAGAVRPRPHCSLMRMLCFNLILPPTPPPTHCPPGVFIPQYTGDDARPRRQKRQRSPRRRSARAQSMSPPLPGTSRVASLGPPGSPTSTLEEQLAYTAGSGAAGKPACEPALPCDSSFAAALCGQRFY